MKKFILLLVGCFISVQLSAQLNGTAFLSGQTNHSGIKIKFLSNGGTAVTDSTTTNSTGNFSINITGGSYKIIYSKSGYLDINYNGGVATILTNTVSLSSQTLSLGNQVFVSGNVNGSWTNNNTYIVNGDLIIPNGQTLTIQQGTNIRFNGTYSITANGVLSSIGNPSFPILYTSNMPSPAPANWKGIVINSNGSVIKYCKLDYFQNGIWMYNCSPLIEHNDISNFDGIAVYAQNAPALISSNHIHDYNTSIYAQGITCDGAASPTIQCNVIHDGGGYGIRPYSGLVINNEIYNINGNTRGRGIEVAIGSPKIQNNFIHNCNNGIQVGNSVTPKPNPLIINNTIVNNVYSGIDLIEFYANASIINNIIIGNSNGIFQSVPSCSPMCSTTPTVVSNNLIWNNTAGDYYNVQITGVGQIVSTNSNGDAVDSYFNLSQDPLFVGAPNLSASSPCFNAGNSAYSNNIGFNPLNGCAAGVSSIKESNLLNNFISVYPNPSKGEIFVITNSINTKYELELLNALGQKIFETKTTEQKQRFDLTGLPKGIYFLFAKENNLVVSNKKLVLE